MKLQGRILSSSIDASLNKTVFVVPMLTYIKCWPQERRRTAAKLGALPPCGLSSSPRNPKKLWSRWLRWRGVTKPRNRLARRIKIPKRRVSAVGGGGSKIARSKLLVWHFVTNPDFIWNSNLFQLLQLSLSLPKWIKARTRPLGRRWSKTVTRAWLLTRSSRRRGRNSFASARWCLLRNPGKKKKYNYVCQIRYSWNTLFVQTYFDTATCLTSSSLGIACTEGSLCCWQAPCSI